MTRRNGAIKTDEPATAISADELAYLQAAIGQQQQAETALASARAAVSQYSAYLQAKYEIAPDDQLQLETGVIVKAKGGS